MPQDNAASGARRGPPTRLHVLVKPTSLRVLERSGFARTRSKGEFIHFEWPRQDQDS